MYPDASLYFFSHSYENYRSSREPFRIASERGVHAPEQNARLTEDFFNRTVENLRSQAEGTRQAG